MLASMHKALGLSRAKTLLTKKNKIIALITKYLEQFLLPFSTTYTCITCLMNMYYIVLLYFYACIYM